MTTALTRADRLGLRLMAALLLVVAVRPASATFIRLVPSATTLNNGASTTLAVQVVATENLQITAASFAFSLDPSRFLLTASSPGSVFAGTGTIYRAFNAGYGSVANPNAVSLSAGQTGTIVNFTVLANGNAPAGPGQFNLLATYSDFVTTFPTSLNNGGIPLTPAPTAAFEPATTDTAITVVPEPAAAAAVAVALSAGLARRRRGG